MARPIVTRRLQGLLRIRPAEEHSAVRDEAMTLAAPAPVLATTLLPPLRTSARAHPLGAGVLYAVHDSA